MWRKSGCLLIYPFVPFAKGFGWRMQGHEIVSQSLPFSTPKTFAKGRRPEGVQDHTPEGLHPLCKRLLAWRMKACRGTRLCPQKLPFSAPKVFAKGEGASGTVRSHARQLLSPLQKLLAPRRRGKRLLAQRMDPFLVSHFVYVSSLKIQNTCLTLSCIMINSSKTWSLFSKVPVTSTT